MVSDSCMVQLVHQAWKIPLSVKMECTTSPGLQFSTVMFCFKFQLNPVHYVFSSLFLFFLFFLGVKCSKSVRVFICEMKGSCWENKKMIRPSCNMLLFSCLHSDSLLNRIRFIKHLDVGIKGFFLSLLLETM